MWEEECCVRCRVRPRGGSFVLCAECYTLSIREGRSKTKGGPKNRKLGKRGYDVSYIPMHLREVVLRAGLWDNAVRAVEDWIGQG